MPQASRTIDGYAIIWTDPAGVSHMCEGSDVHDSVRLLWTLCGKDCPKTLRTYGRRARRFPASSAFL
jgi:hypothetical protein